MKTGFFHVCLFALLLLLPGASPCLAAPWVERHNITAAALQTEINAWTAAPYHLRVARISGSEAGGSARYTVIFEPDTADSDRLVRHGLAAADFTAYHDLAHDNGYRLIWLNGFSVGAAAHYNGIWQKNSRGSAQRVRLSDTLTSHSSANLSNMAAGYYLTDLSTFSVNGSPRQAGVWAFGGGGDMRFSHNLTWQGYQDAFTANTGDGYHPWRVNGFDNDGQERFSAVWRKGGVGAWSAIHGMIAGHFESHHLNHQYTGFRPLAIDPYNFNGATRYSALWVNNGGFSNARLNQLGSLIQDYMEDRNLPGFSLAVSYQGRLVYSRGFGHANTANNELAHPLHRWRIASVSKPVCAVAALRALEDSAVWALDSRCFGSGGLFASIYGDTTGHPYNDNERAITIRQLLTMTAGWNDEGKLWYGDEPGYGENHASIIGWHLDNRNPNWTPGTRDFYNNFNYQVAARVPERITGMTFEAYCKQQIFDPCGMTSFAMGGRTAADRLPNEVAYYAGNQWGSPENVWPARMDGSTAWVGRPSDLLLMGRRIDGTARHTDIIGSYAHSQMQLANGQPDINGNTSTYGLGWYPNTRGGRTWWQHNGAMAGSKALLAVSGDGDIAFAFAANSIHSDDWPSGGLRNQIIDILTGFDNANAWPQIDLFGTYNAAYDAWAADAFADNVTTRAGLADFWAPDADPDGDGRCNALEAYLGSDPVVKNPTPWATVRITGDHLILRWSKRNGDRGVAATPEWSSSLKTWISSSAAQIVNRNDVITLIGHTTQEAQLSRSLASARYLRLGLSVP